MWKKRSFLRHSGIYNTYLYNSAASDIYVGFGADQGLYYYNIGKVINGQTWIISDTIGPQILLGGDVYNYVGDNINGSGYFAGYNNSNHIYTLSMPSSQDGTNNGPLILHRGSGFLGAYPVYIGYHDYVSGQPKYGGDTFYATIPFPAVGGTVYPLTDGQTLTFNPYNTTNPAYIGIVRWKIWLKDTDTNLYEPYTQSAINDGRKHIIFGNFRWRYKKPPSTTYTMIVKIKEGKNYQNADGDDEVKYSSEKTCWFIGVLDDVNGWWESESPLATAGDTIFTFTFDPDNFSGVILDDIIVSFYSIYTRGYQSTLTGEYYGDIARWSPQ